MAKRRFVPKVRFNLDGKDPRRKKVYLIFRYPYKGVTVQLKWSCNVEVDERHWDKQKQRHKVTVASSDYRHINEQLTQLATLVLDIFREGVVPVDSFKDELSYQLGLKKRPGAPSRFFSEYLSWAIERERPNVAYNTSKRWVTVLRNFQEFEKAIGHTYEFEEYDFNWLEAYKTWAYSVKGHSVNNVVDTIKRLRRFFRRAIDEGVTPYNHILFSNNFMPAKVPTNKPVMYDDDVRRLYNTELTGALEVARDIFLIGCYTCLRVSDLKRLKPHHVVNDPDGKMINVITQKTATRVAIPARPELLELLAKYNFSVPETSDQYYNRRLKKVAEIAGFTHEIPWLDSKGGSKNITRVPFYTKVSSHMARRSGATNLYLAGWPPKHIMAIIGHSTQKQLMEYINVGNRLSAQYSREHLSKLEVI